MKPRAGQNQIRSPCPRALRTPARPHVRLSDTPRTGRAAEDVGPYHPSCPERTRRVASERARRAKDSRRLGAGPSGGGGGTARRDRFVVDEKAAFARRGGNGAGVTRKGGRVL